MEVLMPEDVMLNIFSRLSVKTIIRFKCVCKKWRNMVLDSYFVNLHLSRSRPPGLMVHCLSFNDVCNDNKRGTIKLLEIKDDLDLELDVTKLSKTNGIAMVGSVNGLICLLESSHLFHSNPEGDKIYVCNPITKEYIILPKQLYAERVTYGFGVSMSGEYKVIRIFQRTITWENLTEIEVYTLGTGQWRTVGQVPNHVSLKEETVTRFWRIFRTHGLYLNGFVHWFDGYNVYAFDLDKEIFQLLPSSPAKEGDCSQLLGVQRGCLSLYYMYFKVLYAWVLRQNGTVKTWELEIKKTIFRSSAWKWRVPLCFFDGLDGKSLLIDLTMGKIVLRKMRL